MEAEKILIGYLTDGRRYLSLEKFCNELKDSKYVSNYKMLFLASFNCKNNIENILNKTCITYEIIEQNEYMEKMYTFIQYSQRNKFKYCFKIDNDILIPKKIFDYISENIDTFFEDKNLGILFPVMSSSIPGFYFFMEDFFTTNEIREMYNLFDNYKYQNEWNDMNKFLPYSLTLEKYHEMVENMTSPYNGNYKAIHPIRFSSDILKKYNEILLSKKDFFFNNNLDPYIKIEDNPYYFMPQSFLIKTEFFKNLYDKSLHYDDYDEVSLNNMIRRHDKKIGFIRNCFCIHPIHNGYCQDFLEYEKELINKLYLKDFDK